MEAFRQHFEEFKQWDGCQVGPLTTTTLLDNMDTSTCPGRLLPLISDPPVMFYAFLKSLRLLINQVSHPVTQTPLPYIILPSSCFQTVHPIFSHHSIHKSTHYNSFCTPSAPQLHVPSHSIFVFQPLSGSVTATDFWLFCILEIAWHDVLRWLSVKRRLIDFWGSRSV